MPGCQKNAFLLVICHLEMSKLQNGAENFLCQPAARCREGKARGKARGKASVKASTRASPKASVQGQGSSQLQDKPTTRQASAKASQPQSKRQTSPKASTTSHPTKQEPGASRAPLACMPHNRSTHSLCNFRTFLVISHRTGQGEADHKVAQRDETIQRNNLCRGAKLAHDDGAVSHELCDIDRF